MDLTCNLEDNAYTLESDLFYHCRVIQTSVILRPSETDTNNSEVTQMWHPLTRNYSCSCGKVCL